MKNQSVRVVLFIDFPRQKPMLQFLNLCGICPWQVVPLPKDVSVMTEIKLKKGEPVERALRRLKKKVDREGTLKIVRSRRQFEKPSAVRRRKEKVSASPPCSPRATLTISFR